MKKKISRKNKLSKKGTTAFMFPIEEQMKAWTTIHLEA